MEQLMQFAQDALGYLRLIHMTDVIDVAVMSFIIYKLIGLVRRTSSGQVAKGVLLLLAALLAAQFFHFKTLYFFLSQMVEWGVLALIILFQPEIRKVLEQVGSSRLGDVFSHAEVPDEIEHAIEQTVEAYTSLSKSKTGALMVFERKNRFDESIKAGTALDCEVNSELLKNIFWNKAPLHDGAVIVRNGRIVGAGCVLPLSGNVNISRELGMRHRAGIGASEASDAVVAIVSEETGSISVAVGGMLKRHLAPETLDRVLHNELLPQKPAGESQKFRLFQLVKVKKGGNGDGEGNKE
ncbi:MAG TPA: diadenylate cyclase CdaA [Candidatus Flavonifractor intestinipullorum]|uniref:Diadenylate cyclase n=1 Tax=Candidatus Flavonifractor intestinipullorum TaxID=2838587 RepID=A0A9D2S769_9FIRM|nr:diadenylate cyclase CdaA [Candidatus Flavonifractor intestinipullorum]